MVATLVSRPRDDCPVVSVAIPVYNGQAGVAGANCGILSQTCRNLEIIFVNGDSLDDSWHTLWAFWPAIRHSTLEGGPRRGAERAKELFGGLYAEASQASAEAHPPKVFSLLGISLRSDRTITRQMPRTLLRLLVPAPVLTRLRPLGVAAVSIM